MGRAVSPDTLLVSFSEAARLLSVDVATVRRLVAQGHVKAHPILSDRIPREAVKMTTEPRASRFTGSRGHVTMTTMAQASQDIALKAPFPWFGGKSRVAHIVWERFGDVPNYVEPFFGSGAVLLGRPTAPRIETVNDLDGFVANAWRAIASDPEQTARWADWPSNENDLHARHVWLKDRREELSRRLEGDPDYCDFKIAGWWLWGISQWIDYPLGTIEILYLSPALMSKMKAPQRWLRPLASSEKSPGEDDSCRGKGVACSVLLVQNLHETPINSATPLGFLSETNRAGPTSIDTFSASRPR